MFKALEVWMEELEEEFYTSYMRCRNALNDWRDALRTLRSVAEIDVWRIREQLHSDYRGHCCLKVSDRYREEVFVNRGIEWTALIDTIIIDGVSYDYVAAFSKVRGQDKIDWSLEHRVEDEFKDQLSNESGFGKFLRSRQAYISDVSVVEGRDEPWIRNRAHKDMIKHKNSVEAKITKICEGIDTIMDNYSEYIIKGTNGKMCHLWRIMAGGYNIQKLHTRVLCKEIKNKK